MASRRFGPPPGEVFDVVPSQREIDFFRAEGYLAVERITTDEEIDWLREIFEHIFSPEHGPGAGAPVDRSGTLAPGRACTLRQAFFPEIEFPELLTTNHWRNAKRYAAALLGVEADRLSSWGHLIRKAAGGRETPWHQDRAYWQPELDYVALGVWLPLHDVSTEMGAMQFVPGSHRRSLLRHRHIDEPRHNLLLVDEPFDVAEAVACPLRAGGATFHHSHTLHYTAPNVTDKPRLAFPMEFQVTPVRRSSPLPMPWVDEFRRATGAPKVLLHVADGKVTAL